MVLPKILTGSFVSFFKRSETERARLFPDMRLVWLVTLLVGAVSVVIILFYGVLAVRSLDRLEAVSEEQDIPRRLARLLDERLLHATRVYIDASEEAHRAFLENPPTPLVDPAR